MKIKNNADVAELADALDSGSSGKLWGFESLRPHHFYKTICALSSIG